MERHGYVYILANVNNTTLYVGVTSDLRLRIYEHKGGLVEGFSKRYRIDKLVYYEMTDDILAAIKREKQIKSWNRARKLRLISGMNKTWDDLYESTLR